MPFYHKKHLLSDRDNPLEWLAACSPYLKRCMAENPALVARLGKNNSKTLLAAAAESLTKKNTTTQKHIMTALRQFKKQCHLIIAYSDYADYTDTPNRYDQQQAMHALSHCADTCIQHALNCAWRHHAPKNCTTPLTQSGLFILAMGKLGGYELNYSSDVDLIIFYDPTTLHQAIGDTNASALLTRVVRQFVEILTKKTEDGYVWRIDFRLKPDHGTHAAALSLPAAENYYEHQAQNWERAAFIKARVCAGDTQHAKQFLTYLKPFIWRKHLDFTTINEMKAIKTIMQTKSRIDDTILGLDIKRGRGGIRDIEFFVQNLQLLWGGRIPALQTASTLHTLKQLRIHNKIDSATEKALKQAYLFLRRLEHCLQLRADQQTHHIPRDNTDAETIARFMKHKNLAHLQRTLENHRTYVENVYETTFQDSSDSPEHTPAPPHTSAPSNYSAFAQIILNPDHEKAAHTMLNKEGFDNTTTLLPCLRKWLAGKYPSTQSASAQEAIKQLLPTLLHAFAEQDDPVYALTTFDRFLAQLPIGSQLFNHFHYHPSLLSVLADIMGKAPRLAQRLTRRPALLDSMLDKDFFSHLPNKKQLLKELEARLTSSRDLIDSLDIARRWAKDRKFQLGVQTLQNKVTATQNAQSYTDIADNLMAILKPQVEKEFAKTYGTFPNSELAVIAMGKWGGGELRAASDLDMIFVYKTISLDQPSTGPTRLDPLAYYSRLTQRLINALSTKTQSGELYTIDIKLRPSGEQGPLACSLQTFQEYQQTTAWDWEHMALTRARPIHASPTFDRKLTQTITTILTRQRDPQQLIDRTLWMRQRIAQANPHKPWDLKHRIGGIIDIEFIAQYLQLRHAHTTPTILAHRTSDALKNAAQNTIITSKDAQTLIDALNLWQQLDGVIRLCHKDPFDPHNRQHASQGLINMLTHIAQCPTIDALDALIETQASRVAQLFDTLIAPRPT
ncbi:MAG: bifunctional [glutamine synthetase] adenylyltransferase/[glutamine synthetase]-adenylyl-L-tyrosine phosphorylase [Alphaproteobacteria bacterium GM202ARS2]|nr:bifunctional [glutamine synthetase] adenylyltransferase/[glutamine synthetase]-adenylyl-L-tyrosine phosphorylase [Alphaproteobacteria bacterium GM202ARS2]